MIIKKDERFNWKVKLISDKDGYWFKVYCNDINVLDTLHSKKVGNNGIGNVFKIFISNWYRDKMWKSLKK